MSCSFPLCGKARSLRQDRKLEEGSGPRVGRLWPAAALTLTPHWHTEVPTLWAQHLQAQKPLPAASLRASQGDHPAPVGLETLWGCAFPLLGCTSVGRGTGCQSQPQTRRIPSLRSRVQVRALRPLPRVCGQEAWDLVLFYFLIFSLPSLASASSTPLALALSTQERTRPTGHRLQSLGQGLSTPAGLPLPGGSQSQVCWGEPSALWESRFQRRGTAARALAPGRNPSLGLSGVLGPPPALPLSQAVGSGPTLPPPHPRGLEGESRSHSGPWGQGSLGSGGSSAPHKEEERP